MQQKLLKEYIQIILEQEEVVMADEVNLTFGDLKNFLKYTKTKKFAKSALKFAASIAAGGTLSLGINSISKINEYTEETAQKVADKVMSNFAKKYKVDVKSPLKMLAKMYGVNDQEGVGVLEIPDNISELIDDKVEEAFIKKLYKDIQDKDDNEVLKDNYVLDELKKYTIKNQKTAGAYVSIK